MKERILIAGGKGYLGQLLFRYFTNLGHEVYCLTRKPQSETDVYWDGETYGEWIHVLNRCSVLINLAGKSVNCRYTKKNKKVIFDSRIRSTQILGQAVRISKTPPRLWINSSTATIYDHSETRANTEKNGIIGNDFSMNIAKDWEKAARDSNVSSNTRQVFLRTSVVIGRTSEAYSILKTLVKYGLGGKHGSGKQMMSWIHDNDFIRGIEFIMNHNELEGAINLTSPKPISNLQFMNTLRQCLKSRFGISHPEFLLKIGALVIGTESELLLKSRYVVPDLLLNTGFTFKYPNIKDAFTEIEG